jgi:hypothetical protein
MLSWGALLGVYAQGGATPLYIACQQGHVEVVKLLLAHPDVLVNQAKEVRGRGGASRESEGGLVYTPRCCGGSLSHIREGGVWLCAGWSHAAVHCLSEQPRGGGEAAAGAL